MSNQNTPKRARATVSPMPHSWRLSDWPLEVTPNRITAAKHMVRSHRAELIACGALIRIGRDLTIIGEGYAMFLARKAQRVEGYEIAANRPPVAA
jgi:hypothetical protein